MSAWAFKWGVCTYAQTQQSLHCWPTQSMDVDEGSEPQT